MNALTNRNHQPKPASHEANTAAGAITRAVREADRRMRERLPVLRHQTAFGMGFVLLGYGTAIASAWLYLAGVLPFWACIPINAVAFAVLREIEHDLIHNLYFAGKRTLQNIVLFIIWPALGNVPSPLYRRKIHLLHHRSSGRIDDLEERLIGNGTGFGPLRWLTMLDTGLSMMLRRRELEQIPGFRRSELMLNLFPVVTIFYVVWLSFLLYHGATQGLSMFDITPALPDWVTTMVPVLNAIAVVWVLPNVIRQACLQVLSSSMHYYGDVEDTVQQTQVLSKWYWQPLQLISINFGKSHAIHHFVVNQPFYLRELVRREAHAAMRKHGVRFDDLGTFTRANRWGQVTLSRTNEPRPIVMPTETGAPVNQCSVCGGPVLDCLHGDKAGIQFLELKGRLDAARAAEFEQKILETINGGARRLAIDFSGVEYISDSGLRVLLRVAKKLVQIEGKLVLHSLNEQIRQVFHLTGFSLIFSIHRSQREAVRGLSKAGYITVF